MPKDPVRVASGKKSKRKGASNELKLAKQFTAWWGGSFTRTPSSGGFAWRNPGDSASYNSSGDLTTNQKDFPFCIEAKCQEIWSLEQLLTSTKGPISNYWTQCVTETPKHLEPMLIIRKNNQESLCILRESYFAGYTPDALEEYNILTSPIPTTFTHMTLHLSDGQELIIFALKELLKMDTNLFKNRLDLVYREEND